MAAQFMAIGGVSLTRNGKKLFLVLVSSGTRK